MPTEPTSRSGLPPEAVHPGHRHEGGNHVDRPDGQQRGQALTGRRGESGSSEDLVGVVDDGVDTGELLEHGQHDTDDQRSPPRGGEHLPP